MKKLRILGIFLSLLIVLVISVPVTAGTTQTSTTSTFEITRGIEIFPGIDIGGNNYGATFVATVSCNDNDGALAGTRGALRASINYYGTNPQPSGTTIFGGSWTLTVTKNGNVLGTIIGRVGYGTVIWEEIKNNPTGVGNVNLSLSITGGTKEFYRIQDCGGSTFVGHDYHESGKYIGNIQIPTVDGTLTLNY